MNKLQNMDDMVDTAANLSPAAIKRLKVLIDIQRKHDKIEKEFFKEKGALELKYQKLYEPLYAKRYDIVNGVVEVDELKDDSTTNTKEDKGMPAFWLTAMKTNEILAEEISECDEDALKYLKDIKWCRIDDPKGFKLKFIFDTNPYFINSVLTKVYHMNMIDGNEHILEKAIGIDIKWLPRKCLTQKIIKKIPKKGSRYVKPITKTEKCGSFFNFFNPPRVPDNKDDIDEEEAVELLNQMEQDYVIGSTIRDQIIPHAVSWFIGKAAMPDMLVNNNDDDKDDTDDEDEEKSKAKTEESKSKGKTEDTKSKGKTEEEGSNSNAGKTGKQIELPPECQQQ